MASGEVIRAEPQVKLLLNRAECRYLYLLAAQSTGENDKDLGMTEEGVASLMGLMDDLVEQM